MTQAQVRQSDIGHVQLKLKSGGILDERDECGRARRR